MKKNCNGCKALINSPGPTTGLMQCALGYRCEPSKEIHGIVVQYRPLEFCPKPKTNTDYYRQVSKCRHV